MLGLIGLGPELAADGPEHLGIGAGPLRVGPGQSPGCRRRLRTLRGEDGDRFSWRETPFEHAAAGLNHELDGEAVRGHAVRIGPAGQLFAAMKYLAFGWWQMIAAVVCSGWNCQDDASLTSMPIRSAPTSSAHLALSSRSGHAG